MCFLRKHNARRLTFSINPNEEILLLTKILILSLSVKCSLTMYFISFPSKYPVNTMSACSDHQSNSFFIVMFRQHQHLSGVRERSCLGSKQKKYASCLTFNQNHIFPNLNQCFCCLNQTTAGTQIQTSSRVKVPLSVHLPMTLSTSWCSH